MTIKRLQAVSSPTKPQKVNGDSTQRVRDTSSKRGRGTGVCGMVGYEKYAGCRNAKIEGKLPVTISFSTFM